MRFNILLLPTMLLAILLFLLGMALERKAVSKLSRRSLLVTSVVLSLPGLFYVFFYFHFFDNAAWFYNFRALPFSELAAGGIGFAAGMAYSWLRPETIGQKLVAPTGLLILVLIPHLKPLLAPLDTLRLRDTCEGGACLQTTPSTCGPASAAALLTSFGRPSSERHLAVECFSYIGGTESWYLARAFNRRGFSAKVIVLPASEDEIPAPAIAGVTLRGGAGHFIAVLDQTASHVTVFDPLKGLVVFEKGELRGKYHFTGFFLEIRGAPIPSHFSPS